MRGDGLLAVSDTELKSAKAVPALAVRIHLLTQITETPEAWLAALEKQADAVEGRTAAERWQAHEAWWAAFWGRSWIFAHSGAPHPALNPFKLKENADCRMTYTKDMCAKSLDILNRTLLFGTHPDRKRAEVTRQIRTLRTTAKAVLG